MWLATMRRSLGSLLVAFGLVGGLGGCKRILQNQLAEAPHPQHVQLAGLDAPVSIRRDELGVPLIEAQSIGDLMFAQGYVAAEDRYSQMVGFKMLAQGRLSEMIGRPALDVDRYVRTLNLRATAQMLWSHAAPEVKQVLTRYADGVNAWRAQRALPADMRLTGMEPEPWQPQDAMLVMVLLNFSLAQNLQEEVGFLRLAQQVGIENAAWLMPVYPDESLPFDEAHKLAGLDLKTMGPDVKQLLQTLAVLDDLTGHNLAASNNWAVAPARTLGGASIVANDTHLLLTQPATWHYVHTRAPGLDVAGVAAAGLPGVVAGYNGKLAWGMTMVMADNQDLFLEQLKTIQGKLHYRFKEEWLPCRERIEIYRLPNGESIQETVYETHHGPLLNMALQHPPKSDLLPRQLQIGFGLAVKTTAFEPDDTLTAFLAVNRAQIMEQAKAALLQLRSIELNVVYGTREQIGWQVTGRYPIRGKGRGQLPSPGWTGEYDWRGYVPVSAHPATIDPKQGFLATANHRSVDARYPYHLTASWYAPWRMDRINQRLQDTPKHTLQDSQSMQLDRVSRQAIAFGQWLTDTPLDQALQGLPQAQAERAEWAIARLRAFDGNLLPTSADAALYGMFLHHLARETFGDELGLGTEAWYAMVRANDANYGSVDDHLLKRSDSPFWDDNRTRVKESKADIIVRALALAVTSLRQAQGADPTQWQWGRVHTYTWQTETTKMAPHLSWFEQMAISMIGDYLDRGPYAAGGDHATLNVAAYSVGEGFGTWMVPAMRIIVDFSQAEPMRFVNLSGQSSNPGSPHYDDGIEWWLQGRYQIMPFQQAAIDQLYGPPISLIPKCVKQC
ncbi:acyl-homoserine-lactone acylase [Chitinivorax tropicus]|uniref:Acyl-homoserine-lactone acylase n=1 Tax=Chitinivorax tropicus TaxID=714531 RepID=A0A840MLJ6_9PROT|nr:penicillin acylase family protein [Chitinivorax tropicus]MBB5018365.1 acyl-homoserine-lactone acylase [Chitinivorax tropicus]